MPLHTPTVRPWLPRGGRIAALALAAATCASAGAVTIAISHDQPAPEIRSFAEPSQPAAIRHFDEPSKVASMRALNRHIAQQRADRTPRYQDLEANKARSQRAR